MQQKQAISVTVAEKEELEKERLAKESALKSAMDQLEQLEHERQGALEQYEVRDGVMSQQHSVETSKPFCSIVQPS